MKKFSVYFVCGVVCTFLLANVNMAPASELVYEPINPSFGGNPFNAQWLLDSAMTQNKFQEEYERDLMEDFEDHDDIQNVYANFDIPEDILSQIEG